jgi:PadR family transcriptional regulator, regulatory protein PadR
VAVLASRKLAPCRLPIPYLWSLSALAMMRESTPSVFRVNPGSLLPALARMERAGHVKSEWRVSENNRRAKYYMLTARGRKALATEAETWNRQVSAISRIMEA